MAGPLRVALIRASLPSYFPERHGVWDRAEKALAEACEAEGAELRVYPEIPMNGKETEKAVEWCGGEKTDFALLLHGGFTMGDVALALAKSDLRLGFWSVPEPSLEGDVQLNNFVSLNMSMSIARSARDMKRNPVRWYHGAPESDGLQSEIGTTLRALRACKALDGATVGEVGGLAMTFYNLEVSEREVKERLGLGIGRHGIDELVERMRAVDGDRADGELREMVAAAKPDGVSDAHMNLSARCALALKDIADENGHAALAVSDWPALQENPGMHPGAAFSWLEERHALPVASEGDILGAATLLAALAMGGRTGCLLDMTEPDLDDGSLLVWHGGGGPLHLAGENGARWINHPMLGRGTEEGATTGAIADYEFREGPVTVFRISRNGSAMFSMSANVAARDVPGFTGSRGWLRDFVIDGKKASLGDVVATVMGHGLEHHFILMAGDHGDAVAEFGAWCSMDVLAARKAHGRLDLRDF